MFSKKNRKGKRYVQDENSSSYTSGYVKFQKTFSNDTRRERVKELFTPIFEECKESLKVYDADQWGYLPNNPLFSATYLNHILKLYMPTAPIWSNLLLDNFVHRYGYTSVSIVPACSCHFGRTTGSFKSQMRVLKEAVLQNKIHARINEVASKLK